MDKPKCLLCDKPVHWNGLCHAHGERWRRWGCPPLAEWVTAFREWRLLTCVQCGVQFNGYRNRKFCGDDCKMEFKRVAALKNWHRRSPESKREAVKRSALLAQEKRARKKVELVCQVCNGKFVGFPKRKYCSAFCRQAASIGHQATCRSRNAINVAGSALGDAIDNTESHTTATGP